LNLIHFLRHFEQWRHLGVQGVQFAAGRLDRRAVGQRRLRRGRRGRRGRRRRFGGDQGLADVSDDGQHLVHLFGEEFDEDLQVPVHAGHGGPNRVHFPRAAGAATAAAASSSSQLQAIKKKPDIKKRGKINSKCFSHSIIQCW